MDYMHNYNKRCGSSELTWRLWKQPLIQHKSSSHPQHTVRLSQAFIPFLPCLNGLTENNQVKCFTIKTAQVTHWYFKAELGHLPCDHHWHDSWHLMESAAPSAFLHFHSCNDRVKDFNMHRQYSLEAVKEKKNTKNFVLMEFYTGTNKT